ncbi:MAG: carboxypeptidase regulatory-like domain-containing protein [Vicinamibacterales bacterium]
MSAVSHLRRSVSGMAVALAFMAVAPPAFAQSAFTGVARDTSGGVLPGVTVEVASPVLIEGAKSAVTDASGAYRIVDLRPGTYTVSFSLPGFKTARFEGVELRTDFTATFNASLEVGALEESVTVTGASPVVDVSSNAKVEVLTREVLDQVPTGRNIQAYAQLVSGVSLNVPDVGGSRGMQQTYMSTRGLSSANNIVTVDGLMVNGLDGDGAVQQYFNQAMVQEMSYQTSGAGADVSPGGVRMAIVARDGGNQFSGSFFAGFTNGDWMANNLSQDLIDRGLRRAGGIDRIYDFNVGIGGPIKRDRLWFFGSARAWSVDAPIANTFYTPENLPYAQGFAQCRSGAVACEQGIDDQSIESALLRFTWQVSAKHKISAYYDEINKYRGHGMNAGDDPRTASQIWTSPRYNSAALKYTGTLSSSLLLEGGYSFNYEEYVITNQDGVNKTPFSPEWYAGASRRDANQATLHSGLANWGGRYPDRFALAASLSYVTGSHNFKVGIQDNWGPYVNTRETNADLQQVYLSGVPNSVTIYNTPLRYKDSLVADIGIYAQDTWTLDRLTVNAGLRWEYMDAEVSASTSGHGRFVPERTFDAIPMPVWKDFAPRFGVVYDLFGNAKTALKLGINRYNESRTTQFAGRYNPLTLQSASLSWTDLNGNDVAEGTPGCTYLTPGCEMNFAQMPRNFGIRSLNTVDPDFQRTYNWETTVGVQHELFPRVSVSATWYRRAFHDLRVTDNLLRSMSDYRAVDVMSPLDGSVFQVYTVNPSAVALVDNFDTNATDGFEQVYNGFDVTFNARLPRGGTMFGGFTTERTMRVVCGEPDDPNLLRFCDDADNDIPWRPQMKVSGTYPLFWGIQVSGAFQSLAGRALGGYVTTPVNKISGPGYGDVGSPAGTSWLITRATRYPNTPCNAPCVPGGLVVPNLTEASITVPLVAPGTEFLDRITQFDLSFAKWFGLGGNRRLQGQLDIFNVFNANPVLGVQSVNFGTAAYNQPNGILNGRTMRVGLQLRW